MLTSIGVVLCILFVSAGSFWGASCLTLRSKKTLNANRIQHQNFVDIKLKEPIKEPIKEPLAYQKDGKLLVDAPTENT